MSALQARLNEFLPRWIVRPRFEELDHLTESGWMHLRWAALKRRKRVWEANGGAWLVTFVTNSQSIVFFWQDWDQSTNLATLC